MSRCRGCSAQCIWPGLAVHAVVAGFANARQHACLPGTYQHAAVTLACSGGSGTLDLDLAGAGHRGSDTSVVIPEGTQDLNVRLSLRPLRHKRGHKQAKRGSFTLTASCGSDGIQLVGAAGSVLNGSQLSEEHLGSRRAAPRYALNTRNGTPPASRCAGRECEKEQQWQQAGRGVDEPTPPATNQAYVGNLSYAVDRQVGNVKFCRVLIEDGTVYCRSLRCGQVPFSTEEEKVIVTLDGTELKNPRIWDVTDVKTDFDRQAAKLDALEIAVAMDDEEMNDPHSS
ncbi:unnamed protein product [Prorocentrum cordatum]|uniref:Uncharacterized protein n=1 Tax=Prorocentrum cordatum TaxID=2364126 RepID=A0ABN9SKK2_9DINO|nr:unnamed protein product [Polarella glacialis]